MDDVLGADGGVRVGAGNGSAIDLTRSASDAVVVTGAAGFIGSHLVERLLADGHAVTGIDDFDPWYDPAVKRANLAKALAHPRFTLVEGDLAGRPVSGIDTDRLIDLFSDAKMVFHLAGRPGVQDSWGTGFGDYVERNVAVTQRVYEAALAGQVDRVVYASSSSVYGTTSAAEAERDTAPVSPYGVSKLAGEHLAGVYRARGLSVTSLRYFTVYGPRQRPDMAMHRLFRAAMADGQVFVLRGDGTQRREFTHVSDVVAATVAAGWRAEAAEATIDVGGGSSVPLLEVIDTIEQIVGAPVRLRTLPAAAGDPPATRADHEGLRQLLGVEPATDLVAGLTSQWRWHRQPLDTDGSTSPSTPSSTDDAPALTVD
ncbi:MAG: NAD-dependent epimerase/dehydratase family protein [Actinomycetota bacterium]